MPRFHVDTTLARALKQLLEQLEGRLSLERPLPVWLAGGMAVHLYTRSRVTTDVDAEFGARVLPPSDLVVEATLEDGTTQALYLDTNYNPTFALLHEDYQDEALPLDFGLPNIRLFVLSPVDLAVSKIARFADIDRDDICELVRHGLTTADEIEARAMAALPGFVGGLGMLRINIEQAVALARTAQAGSDKSTTGSVGR